MPLAALEEREKRVGGSGSKMSDNEHSTASLGNSEVSRVQHSPANAIPELGQRRENDGEIASTVRGKESGNILKEDPGGSKSVDDADVVEEERRPLAFDEARSSAGDAEVLAGTSPGDEIDRVRYVSSIWFRPLYAFIVFATEGTNVGVAGDAGEPLGED